jgi:3-deoxy-7-phosphoheptulonate synthase
LDQTALLEGGAWTAAMGLPARLFLIPPAKLPGNPSPPSERFLCCLASQHPNHPDNWTFPEALRYNTFWGMPGGGQLSWSFSSSSRRTPMIIVLRPDSTDVQIEHILDRIRELGFKPHISRGEQRTIIGVIGDESRLQVQPLQAIPGVEQVLPVLKPFKLASREMRPADTIVEVGADGGPGVKPVRIGGGSLALIAGPCAVEGAEILDTIAGQVKAAGANILRGGAFKPRTSPYSFQGLGEEGLKILRDVGHRHGLPVVTEVMDPRQVDLVVRYADMLQIGARNMQNFDLLKEVGQTRKPVLLKRGMSATVKDLLMSAEYILSEGNPNVVLCERGVRSFEDSTRNMLDMSAVPNVKGQSHLPIIVDPSHATGRPDLIPAMARASIAAGADGVHVEVHSCPEKALSDGPQALLPHQYASLVGDLRRLADLLGKSF